MSNDLLGPNQNNDGRRAKARRILRSIGRAAFEGFVGNFPGAVSLSTREPAWAWENKGVLHYASVWEFAGPNASDGSGAPFLIRIQVNENPPPSLDKHLERCGPNSMGIADSPVLNVFARAKETRSLGAWVALWHRAWLRDEPLPPKPPEGIKLVAEIMKENSPKEIVPLASLGEDWRYETHVWTRRAKEAFDAFHW
jgi:hypothetical protein